MKKRPEGGDPSFRSELEGGEPKPVGARELWEKQDPAYLDQLREQGEREVANTERFISEQVATSDLAPTVKAFLTTYLKTNAGPWSQYDGKDIRLTKIASEGTSVSMIFGVYVDDAVIHDVDVKIEIPPLMG